MEERVLSRCMVRVLFAPVSSPTPFSHPAVLLVPASVFQIASGALFGVPLGMAVTLAGCTTGMVLCFLVARCAISEWDWLRITAKLCGTVTVHRKNLLCKLS